jgi:hypothetical protein
VEKIQIYDILYFVGGRLRGKGEKMQKNDYKARLGGFLLKLFVMFFIFGGIYGFYLYNIYRSMPKLKTDISQIYTMFGGGQEASGQTQQEQKKSKQWTQIDTRTSDETLEQVGKLDAADVEKKVKEVEGYDRLLNGNSVKFLNMITSLLSKKGGDAVMTGDEENQMKDMIEKILDAYKNKTYPGVKDIEKETGKM